jgi:hypothetical protein
MRIACRDCAASRSAHAAEAFTGAVELLAVRACAGNHGWEELGWRVSLRDRNFLLLLSANFMTTMTLHLAGISRPTYLFSGLATAWR